MARYFSLSSRAGLLGLSSAGVLILAAFCPAALRADPSMVPPPSTNSPPKTATAPAGTPKAIAKAPAAAKVVPPVPDTFNRYGKIWTPSDDVAHPLKLNAHFPGVTEIKVPSQDELNDRDKLEQLSMLSDAEIRAQLEQWPPYSKMKLGDQGQMLSHIQQFKDQRTKIAMDKAHELGILDSLTPDQKIRFEKDYWDTRRQMDHDEVKQIEPILKTWDQKLAENLFRKYSSASLGPVAQVPKPPPANKPGQPPAPQIKAAASAPSAPATNVAEPMAQAPR